MAGAVNMNVGRKIDRFVGSVLIAVLFAWSRLRATLGGPPQPSLYGTTPPEAADPPIRPRRVLAIKLYGLGNIAMLLPVLAAVRRGLPGVEIDFLSLEENRSLLERSGLVDRVHSVRAESYVGLAAGFVRTFAAMRTRHYDAVLDFEQFIKLSSILAYLTGAPTRVGFNTDGQGRGALYTTRVVYRDGDHMSDVFMRILQPLDIDRAPRRVEIPTTAEEAAGVERFLHGEGLPDGHRPVIAVHVGSGPNFYKLALKRWPTEAFAALCDRLIEERGAAIVLTGKGDEEARLVQAVTSQMKQTPLDACDRLSIGELLALLKRVELTISNDTSVMHLAALVGTPVTAFFGPTDPMQYGPRGVHDAVLWKDYHCSPCLTNYNLKISYCTNPVCIRSITPDETFETVSRQLQAIANAAREEGGA